MKVEIPFEAHWQNKMLNGIKTCTSRTKRYGKEGDIFEVFDATFEIARVEKETLQIIFFSLIFCTTRSSPRPKPQPGVGRPPIVSTKAS